MKSKKKAAAFAIFGGFFGLHKFYLGETGNGIFYIFLTYMLLGIFRLPITVFLGFIDAMKLLGMSDEAFDQKYNSKRTKNRRKTSNTRTYQSTEQRKRRQIELERERQSYQRRKINRKNPFKDSAVKKYKEFDLEESIKDFEQALEISPGDPEIHFYMAKCYALLEKKEKAYLSITEAQKLGYKVEEEILKLDDFAFLRIQPDFDQFKQNGYVTFKAIEAPKSDLLQDDALLSQLTKLKELRDKGLLSDKEFILEKEKLMRR